MRSKNDYTYLEWKENTRDDFLMHEKSSWTAEECVDYIIDEELENHTAFEFVGTIRFLFLLSVAVREFELDILEERVRQAISYHIILYTHGEYKDDLTPEEIAFVEKDIEFLKDQKVLLTIEQLEDLDKKGLLNRPVTS